MNYPEAEELLGDPTFKLDGESNISKSEKRNAWNYAININQLDGEWIPSKEYMEFIEREINGEITTEQMREILTKKYSEN